MATASAVWALLTPLGSVPDEPSHVRYAAGVVTGQIGVAGGGGTIDLPRGLVDGTSRASCTAFVPLATTRCQGPIPDSRDIVTVAVPSAKYPPLYFAIVGLPTLFGFNEVTWYAMRALSVALGVGLLAIFIPASRRLNVSWLVLGSALAVTPMASYMLGSVNPNGVEIIAGMATSIGVGLMLLAATRRDSAGFVAALTPTMVSLGYLMLARPKSYLLAAGLVAVTLLVMPTGTWSLVRSNARAVLLRLSLPVAALVLAFAFERIVSSPAAASTTTGSPTEGVRRAAALFDDWLIETIGIFGWRDHAPPQLLALVWLAAIGGLFMVALATARGRQRLGLLALVVGGAMVAPTFVVLTLFPTGAGYQGRYEMPITIAVAALSAAVMSAAGTDPGPVGRRLAGWAVAGVGFIYMLVWGGSLLRYAVGLPVPGPARFLEAWTWWLDPFGSLLLLGAFGAFLLVLATLRRSLRTDASWVAAPDDVSVLEAQGDGENRR